MHASVYPRLRSHSRLLLLAGIALAVHPAAAEATVVNVDEFSVMRNGGALFDDTFSANTTLSGGNGTILPSGVSFNGDGPANYFVGGTIPETTANNGQATLNTANGVLIPQPPPFIPFIQDTRAFLQTGTVASGTHSLTPTTSFTVTALFDLSVPSVILGTYALNLSNRYVSNGRMGNVLELRMRQCQAGVGLCGSDNGTVLQLFWGDFVNNTETLINQVQLSAAQLANSQIEFEFTKGANSDVINAFYGLGSGNTLGSFNGSLTSLDSTDSATDVFTSSLQTVQAGVEAFDPVAAVPEPSSLMQICGGLLGLALAWRRRRS